MSESEQSWSFASERSNLQRGRLLVCAMAEVKPDKRWPMDNRAFALAVDKQTAKGNPIASSINVYTGVAGRHCPDFNEMLSYALSSCLIEYLSPSYTEMVLNIGRRSREYLREGVREDEMEAAKALVLEFWKEVYGDFNE
jgi:hypothetical protein